MITKDYATKELGIKIKAFIDQDCSVWFKAKEVAKILGYKRPDDAVKKHISENHKRKIVQPRISRDCTFSYLIDEAGFYELVFKSRLPAAVEFREWVFTKVLPSIRKHGYYEKFDTISERRVIVDGKKYYKHPVFSNYAANEDGTIINVKKGTKKKMSINNRGYLFFSIYYKSISTKAYYQHRFVYEVFKGPIPKWFEIDHINNEKTDNRIKNLQLLTHKENIDKIKKNI